MIRESFFELVGVVGERDKEIYERVSTTLIILLKNLSYHSAFDQSNLPAFYKYQLCGEGDKSLEQVTNKER